MVLAVLFVFFAGLSLVVYTALKPPRLPAASEIAFISDVRVPDTRRGKTPEVFAERENHIAHSAEWSAEIHRRQGDSWAQISDCTGAGRSDYGRGETYPDDMDIDWWIEAGRGYNPPAGACARALGCGDHRLATTWRVTLPGGVVPIRRTTYFRVICD